MFGVITKGLGTWQPSANEQNLFKLRFGYRLTSFFVGCRRIKALRFQTTYNRLSRPNTGLNEAKSLLQTVIKTYESLKIPKEASSITNARSIIRGIETDPLGLEAKLIATAVQTAENFKITKFWTKPEKFWDKPPQLP